MNEDESKKQVIVQAMFSLLDNMNDSDTSETPMNLENCSLSPGIAKICKESEKWYWWWWWIECSYCEIGIIAHSLYHQLNQYYQSSEYGQLEDTMVRGHIVCNDPIDINRTRNKRNKREIC